MKLGDGQLRSRRALGARSSSSAVHKLTRRRRHRRPPPRSASIILLNKKVLSHYNFKAVNSLLTYHCVIAVVLLRAAAAAGWVEITPLTRQVFLQWAPLNVIFVGMLATAFKSLGLVRAGRRRPACALLQLRPRMQVHGAAWAAAQWQQLAHH